MPAKKRGEFRGKARMREIGAVERHAVCVESTHVRGIHACRAMLVSERMGSGRERVLYQMPGALEGYLRSRIKHGNLG